MNQSYFKYPAHPQTRRYICVNEWILLISFREKHNRKYWRKKIAYKADIGICLTIILLTFTLDSLIEINNAYFCTYVETVVI